MESDLQSGAGVRSRQDHRRAHQLPQPGRPARADRLPTSYFLKPTSSLSESGRGRAARRHRAARLRGRDRAHHRAPPQSTATTRGATSLGHRGQRLRAVRPARDDKGSNALEGRRRLHTDRPDAVAPDVDPAALRLRTWVNGNSCRTTRPRTSCSRSAQLVADLSQHFTLERGDVILTGTPAGSSVVVPGDVVEVEVDAPTRPESRAPGASATPSPRERYHSRTTARCRSRVMPSGRPRTARAKP